MKRNRLWAILAATAIIAVFFVRWFTWNRMRPVIAWTTDTFAGMRVDIKGDLNVVPSGRLAIDAQDVRVTDKRDGKTREPFLELQQVAATWRLPALRDRRIQVEEASLGTARLHLDRFAEVSEEEAGETSKSSVSAWTTTWSRLEVPSLILTRGGKPVGEWSGEIGGELRTSPFALDGAVVVRGKNLKETLAALGYQMTEQIARYRLKGKLHYEKDRLIVADLDAEVGRSAAVGKIALAFSPLDLDASVHFSELRFDDLGAFLPQKVQEELPATRLDSSSSSLYSQAPISKEWMSGARLAVEAKVDRFEGDGKASLVKSFDLKIDVRNGKADLSVPRSSVMGGDVQAHLALADLADGVSARLDGSARGLKAGRVVQEFLSSESMKRKRFGKLKADELVEGEMDAFLDVKGRGPSMAAIMSTLDGKAGIQVGEGKVSSLVVELLGLDLTESVGVLLARKQTVGMQCVVVGVDARDGVLTMSPAYVSTSDSDLLASGEIDLADEEARIELRTYPKDPSIGVLRTPIKLSGQLVDPRVRLETKDLAGRIAIGVALGLLSPAASLLATLEPGNAPPRSCNDYRTKLASLRITH